MESYVVLRQVLKQPGCKQVARELNLSLSLIYQWSRGQQGHSEAANPLDRVAQLAQLPGGDALLDWLCRQRGGRFVRRTELPSFVRRCWNQIKAEMESLLKTGAGRRMTGGKSPLTRAGDPDGARCRHRLPNGRCGFRGTLPSPARWGGR